VRPGNWNYNITDSISGSFALSTLLHYFNFIYKANFITNKSYTLNDIYTKFVDD